MTKEPGVKIVAYEAPTIANLSWEEAATASNIVSGFRATGIFPFDREFVRNNLDKFRPSTAFFSSQTSTESTAQETATRGEDAAVTRSEANRSELRQWSMEEGFKLQRLRAAPEVAEKLLQNEDALATVAAAISSSLQTDDQLAASAASVTFETIARLGSAMPVIVNTSTGASKRPRLSPLGESTARAKLLNTLQRLEKLKQHHQSKKQREEAQDEQKRQRALQQQREYAITLLCFQLRIADDPRLKPSWKPLAQAKLRKLVQQLQLQRAIKDHYGAALSTLTRSQLVDFLCNCVHLDEEGIAVFRQPVTVGDDDPLNDDRLQAAEQPVHSDDEDSEVSTSDVSLTVTEGPDVAELSSGSREEEGEEGEEPSSMQTWADVLQYLQQENLRILPRPSETDDYLGRRIVFRWNIGWYPGVVHSRTNEIKNGVQMNYLVRYDVSSDLQFHQLIPKNYVDTEATDRTEVGMYVFVVANDDL